jgi:hypothetical protein
VGFWVELLDIIIKNDTDKDTNYKHVKNSNSEKLIFLDKIRIQYKYSVSLQSKLFRYNTDTIWINTFKN